MRVLPVIFKIAQPANANLYPGNWSMCISANERVASAGCPLVRLSLLSACLLFSGCSVGPKYVRPPVQTAPANKELPQRAAGASDAWQTAKPSDSADRGEWWTVFNDPKLNELEEQANSSNQQVIAAADNFLAARALVRQARSQYFPTLTTDPSVMRILPSPAQFSGLQAGSSSSSGFAVRTYNDFSLPFDASWEPDFWGRVINNVKASAYAAQASAADLENVRLGVQAELAVDYYELRAEDSLKEVFDSTVVAYQEDLELTRSQYKAGLNSDEAVAQAEAQLKAALAQDTNLGILRAQYEHAIAVLIGQSPSAFSLPVNNSEPDLPEIPVGIPSDLLDAAQTLRPQSAPSLRRMQRLGWQRPPIFQRSCSTPLAGSGTLRYRVGSPGLAVFGLLVQALPKRSLTPDCARRSHNNIAQLITKPWQITSKPC